MQSQELEPEMEMLLLRLYPDLAKLCEGASEDEIDSLEAIAGRPLPRFYRWFLSRMGRSIGPLQFRSLDLSLDRILQAYKAGLVVPNPRFLMIGFETDEVMPLHLFYDFEHPARQDARVTSMECIGSPMYDEFDTFREMLAWGQFTTSRILRLPQVCRGLFDADGGRVLERLDPVMINLGFAKPVPMGDLCAVYDRPDAGLSASATPGEDNAYVGFHFGANDVGTVRKILGTISSALSLEVDVREWTPPLSVP